MLTKDNYSKGFLIDEELMGGVTETGPGAFAGFVLKHTTGEYIGYETYPHLEAALAAINRVERPWAFEAVGGCGGGKCGEGGCNVGNCANKKAQEAGLISCQSGTCAT
jgi:hypothetical protein